MRGRGSKMSVFSRSRYKNCPHGAEGVKKWQNSVHVVVECPLIYRFFLYFLNFLSLDANVMVTQPIVLRLMKQMTKTRWVTK